MSSTSVTSSKREAQEKISSDLMLELDAARTLNTTLRAYLDHIRLFKKNLRDMNDNYQQLSKVNKQWKQTLNVMK